jgi:hypothetical protein
MYVRRLLSSSLSATPTLHGLIRPRGSRLTFDLPTPQPIPRLSNTLSVHYHLTETLKMSVYTDGAQAMMTLYSNNSALQSALSHRRPLVTARSSDTTASSFKPKPKAQASTSTWSGWEVPPDTAGNNTALFHEVGRTARGENATSMSSPTESASSVPPESACTLPSAGDGGAAGHTCVGKPMGADTVMKYSMYSNAHL